MMSIFTDKIYSHLDQQHLLQEVHKGCKKRKTYFVLTKELQGSN